MSLPSPRSSWLLTGLHLKDVHRFGKGLALSSPCIPLERPIRNSRMPDRAEDSTTAGLFFARRGPYTFPCRRCDGACLSAAAGHADDIEEIAHHAKIVS